MREKIRKFMYGRYGVDQLNRFILGSSMCFLLLSLLFHSSIWNIFAFLALVVCYIRMLSKNIQKRSHENKKYIYYKNILMRGLKRDKNNHIYKCPNCKQKIRIPKGKGKIEICCPKCSTRFIKNS